MTKRKQTFKERYRDLQEIVRELGLVRAHNLNFREGDDQAELLLMAEAMLCFLALERFLRVVPGVQATNKDTLPNLLEKATSRGRNLLHFVDSSTGQPILDEKQRQQIIREIKDVRNTLLHGNYEQAAQQAGLATKEEYFREQFASEIEELYRISNSLVGQIDPETGESVRSQTPMRRC